MQFEINGSKFWISESVDGYTWMPPLGTGRLCATKLDAQQDAINCIQKQINNENFNLILDSDDYHDQRRHEND